MSPPSHEAIGPLAVVPAIAAAGAVVALVVGWRQRRIRSGWPGVVAGAVSLAATVMTVASPPDYGELAGVVGLAECAALLLLIAAAVRWAPRRQAVAAATAAGLAVAVCVLRFLPSDSMLDMVGACVLWSGGPLTALVIGGYPRLAEDRRLRSVLAAQQAQRLALARDLHDFVAHDVSGIVALAQAARFVADADPGRALDALARVEAAGLRALDTMDRTVGTLRDLAGTPDAASLPGLDDLPALLVRFNDTVRVEADLGTVSTTVIPPDVGTTAYRLVTEALTNIRRHAPTATTVRTSVCLVPGPALSVTITNDDPTGTPATPGNGTGIAELRHRVHLLGGTLHAGPHDDGWRISAVLPLERA